MADIFLTTSFKDKDKVKSLGARWDPGERRWYVPDGIDLAPFAPWLQDSAAVALLIQPAASAGALSTHTGPDGWAGDLTVSSTSTTALTVQRKGMRLSQLLAGVAQAVSQAFKAGVWTLVEVVEARLSSGHVYVELSERGADGTVLAKANAVIWASTASRILPEFERATGAKLAPGIKLLVRAKPVFKPQYGFSVEIDAIDPEYTLGDLEAKKREIRTRLRHEGVFEDNRRLPQPWDYNAVLVVAPQGAAGLGDFQAEADRLQRGGICHFVYATSRFQGEGAAAEIRAALLDGLDTWRGKGAGGPDAVVIIRGGGAVNDLAWLNDYDLARCICELDLPVLTGIGHERDSTVLDEVANQKFDTPSKVILGIEQTIRARVNEARQSFEAVVRTATRATQGLAREIDQLNAATTAGALRHLTTARQTTAGLLSEVQLGAVRSVQQARAQTNEHHGEIRHLVVQQVAAARQAVPAQLATVLDRAAQATQDRREAVERGLANVADGARRGIADAATQSEALVREITGQGPDKTLARGFALVRSAQGKTISGAAQVPSGAAIEIEFHDGRLPAISSKQGEQP